MGSLGSRRVLPTKKRGAALRRRGHHHSRPGRRFFSHSALKARGVYESEAPATAPSSTGAHPTTALRRPFFPSLSCTRCNPPIAHLPRPSSACAEIARAWSLTESSRIKCLRSFPASLSLCPPACLPSASAPHRTAPHPRPQLHPPSSPLPLPPADPERAPALRSLPDLSPRTHTQCRPRCASPRRHP